MKIKLIAVMALVAGFSAASNAAFISADLNQLSDNRVVLDEESGIEWLSLKETDGKSYNATLARLQDGGDLYGWRLPTLEEYHDMFIRHLNIAEGEEYKAGSARFNGVSTVDVSSWKNLFGHTYSDRSMGYIMRDNGTISVTGVISTTSAYGTGYGTYTQTGALMHYGTYLVSDGGVSLTSINDPSINANNPNAPSASVPLSATFGLLALGIAGLSRRNLKTA